MKMTDAERELLLALFKISRAIKKADPDTLRRYAEYQYDGRPPDWEPAFQALIEKGWVNRHGNIHYLTEQGFETVGPLYQGEMFSGALLQCEASQTYGTYCERVYGRNLTQFNMTDDGQLAKLIEVLDLKPGDRALDLGCGVGVVTEYLSDVTDAHFTGIDTAFAAIRRATERTADKASRLQYVEADMDDLPFDEHTYDRIISIDTLYFVEDLDKTVARIREILTEDGQVVVFWSQVVQDGSETGLLQPGSTKFAKALAACGMDFETWDYTPNEHQYWKRSLDVLEELRDEFEREGSLAVYKRAKNESEHVLKRTETGRNARFLYRAWPA